MITFSPVQVNESMLQKYAALFAECFPPSSKFSPEAIRWLYSDNPDGQVVGFDAMYGGELAAHYVTIPAKIMFESKEYFALLSLNTATHPKFQGRGLFTKLAELTYSRASELGYFGVFGIANGNSTPGFVKKLGFKVIQPLDALIGCGRLDFDFDRIGKSTQFQRIWSAESLRWRCRNPSNPVSMHIKGRNLALTARAVGAGIVAYAELPKEKFDIQNPKRVEFSPFRVYLGLTPGEIRKTKTFYPIPERLRPSPLNFIFRSLQDPSQGLEKNSIFFSFVDFDAY